MNEELPTPNPSGVPATYDTELRRAWEEFCDRLKDSVDLVFREEAPSEELDRATGVRYLSRYIAKAFNDCLEFNDPLFPQLWVMQTPTNKSFGDNPDCTYLATRIDGSQTYRLVGNRGTVSWVRFNVTTYDDDGIVGWSNLTGPAAMLASEDLEVEWDGSFEVILSPEPHEGNWLRTHPGLGRLLIRQFYGDWTTEDGMSLRIERVGAKGDRPAPLSAARMVKALRDVNNYIEKDSDRWFRWINNYRQWPNRFTEGRPSYLPGDPKLAESNVGRWVHYCYWELADDECLVITFIPPPCTMWIFELNNFWMNSMDYRYHPSSMNDSQAVVEDDGSVTIVLSSADPGVPNWMDAAGHHSGLVIKRWVGADSNPAPDARVVKLADLGTELAGARRCTSQERLRQLRDRRIGVDRRWGYWA